MWNNCLQNAGKEINKMLVKIIKSYRDIVIICDSDLLGKSFEQGKFQLDIKESFYKGEETPKESIIKIMKRMSAEDASFNITGRESVETAIEAGIISKKQIKTIQGVPFTLVLL